MASEARIIVGELPLSGAIVLRAATFI